MESSQLNAFQSAAMPRMPSGGGAGESTALHAGQDPSMLLHPPETNQAAGRRETLNEEVDEEPYFHLRARNIFRKEAKEFDHRLRELEAVEDSYERSVRMIDHSKTFVTALDRKKGLAEIMGFELFIEDYLEETTWIAQ